MKILGGPKPLGSMMNVFGEPFDQRVSIRPPNFMEMSVEQEILVTGIKVVDMLALYIKGGKIALSARVDKTALIMELNNIANAQGNDSVFVGVGERTCEGNDLCH